MINQWKNEEYAGWKFPLSSSLQPYTKQGIIKARNIYLGETDVSLGLLSSGGGFLGLLGGLLRVGRRPRFGDFWTVGGIWFRIGGDGLSHLLAASADLKTRCQLTIEEFPITVDTFFIVIRNRKVSERYISLAVKGIYNVIYMYINILYEVMHFSQPDTIQAMKTCHFRIAVKLSRITIKHLYYKSPFQTSAKVT